MLWFRNSLFALAAVIPSVAHAEPVLLISIDGLQPADVIEADRRGIAVPNLKRFITEGSYASGVVGVLPTVTYPSHATLLTGTSPAKHGIISNTGFDPKQINQSGWYWYASDYRVPTLWDASAKAGYKTANVHWPVSVGASAINFNLPQVWRTGHEDDVKLMKVLATPDLVDRLEKSVGAAYAQGIDESIEGDENRALFVEALIRSEKPIFMTAYFTALDHEQHDMGPDTKEAHTILQRIDAIIGKVVKAQLASHPDSAIAVVSDHGFVKTDTEINLFRAFIDAGLITLGSDGKISDWLASPWNAGGSTAIMLKRPDDADLIKRVGTVLDQLKANSANRIAAIATPAETAAMGGNPQASFYVNFAYGAYGGGFKGKDAPLVGPSGSKGTHGYFPDGKPMRSSFMLMGAGIAKGRNLGEIDMRAIAPTLAQILKVPLPDAEVKAILD
jgi:predicted AlkP superfamily pyrophosphatase or phosphodiesterase